jgi:hypothetical protein
VCQPPVRAAHARHVPLTPKACACLHLTLYAPWLCLPVRLRAEARKRKSADEVVSELARAPETGQHDVM